MMKITLKELRQLVQEEEQEKDGYYWIKLSTFPSWMPALRENGVWEIIGTDTTFSSSSSSSTRPIVTHVGARLTPPTS